MTHDQVEALSLGDRIAVMKSGRIVQCDVPMNIYDDPASVFVGGFIGTPPMNFLKGVVSAEGAPQVPSANPASCRQKLAPALAARHGQDILLGIRPENLAFASSAQGNTIRGPVVVVEPLGSHKLLTMQVSGETIKVSVPPDQAVVPRDDVWLHFDADKIRWMDAASGDAIQ